MIMQKRRTPRANSNILTQPRGGILLIQIYSLPFPHRPRHNKLNERELRRQPRVFLLDSRARERFSLDDDELSLKRAKIGAAVRFAPRQPRSRAFQSR